jgi:acyl-CoA oxidase
MSVIDKIETENESATIDHAFLHRFLLGKWADIRLASRELAGRPEMHGIPGLSKDEHRARTLEQLKLLVKNGQVNLSFPLDLSPGLLQLTRQVNQPLNAFK